MRPVSATPPEPTEAGAEGAAVAPPGAVPASPAPARLQALVAVAFVAVWLALEAWDFVANGNAPVLPLWWHAIGLIVLGYVLGMNVPTLLGGLLKR